ncbi:unnamed protein product [Periconia digitata]|uniref:Uncharacterized protein n=1 Tax=Periconia digitata TaxID=1303443 RepID=A0A9W4U371_9PLEO|nr:unnamed protein product [Periconia digitata]
MWWLSRCTSRHPTLNSCCCRANHLALADRVSESLSYAAMPWALRSACHQAHPSSSYPSCEAF